MHGGQLAAWNSTAKRVVIVAGRRWGKTEVGSMRMIRGAQEDRLAGKDSIRWVVGPTFDHCRIIWRKIHRLSPRGWITGQRGTEGQPDWIEFGPSKIVFRSAERPRNLVGEGLADVWLDEAGNIKDGVWVESILPTLIDNDAPALLTGTPKGRNFFAIMAEKGADPENVKVERFGGCTYENPYLTEEAIAEVEAEVRALGGGVNTVRQEIWAIFLEAIGRAFEHVDWNRLVIPGGRYEGPRRGHLYVAGVDTARVEDFTFVVILDATTGRVVYTDRFNRIKYSAQEKRIAKVVNHYRAHAFVDATAQGGDRICEELEKLIPKLTRIPFSGRKFQMYQHLIQDAETPTIQIPEEAQQLVREMKATDAIRGPRGTTRYEAMKGFHDDGPDALVLACLGRREYHQGDIDVGTIPPARGRSGARAH